MKAILFDLGDTLESGGQLMPDALATLQAVQGLPDQEGQPPLLGLLSDFKTAHSPAEEAAFTQEYYDIIAGLGIREFFEPVAVRVTLSTEVGVNKPSPKIFRAALAKLAPALTFATAAFITENAAHVSAARTLGMKAICLRGAPPVHPDDVETLADIVPLLTTWLAP